MSVEGTRDDAPLPENAGILPTDSREKLSGLVAMFLGEASPDGSGAPYHVSVLAAPMNEIGEPRTWSDAAGVGASLPPWLHHRHGAVVLVPLKDSYGLVMEDANQEGMGLALCVTSGSPRQWTTTEIAALSAVATVAGLEVQLRIDIARQQSVAEKLHAHPLHDPVTELATRELFLDRVAQALMRCARKPERNMAVMSLGIDQFAEIQSGFGYDAAQEVLKEIARRLTVAVRNVDSVARLSGDEFGVLLESLRDDSDAARVAKRIHDVLRAPIKTSYEEFIVSASIGVVLSNKGLDSASRLLQLASLARERSNNMETPYELFDPAMQKKAQARLNSETELRRAIDDGEFELHYQPIISLQSGSVVALEALCRWRHPKRGMVNAAEFIALAEETGLIVPMGWTVLTQACGQLCEWRSRNEAQDITVSINMNAAHLAHRELGGKMRKALSDFGLATNSVNVEITEGILIRDPDSAKRVLDDLRTLGVGVHIDDFGTGYSSLQYLHQLPLDAIKIDRRFVARMGDGSREAQVAVTIRELARQIGVPVIAEGIETEEQLRQVRALGCEFAQGYFFSRPLPPDKIADFLRENPNWS